MREELSIDFDTHNCQLDTPLFHRIKFDETSIYLTKTTSYGINTAKNAHGQYRVFSWIDPRAKAFLGFELGQKSPKLGDAQLIGTFIPVDDNLTDVRYISSKGKAFYKNAKSTIDGDDTLEESTKINVDNYT